MANEAAQGRDASTDRASAVRVVGEDDTGGEAPRAVVHDADGEAEVLGVAGGLEDAVARTEVLVAVALEPEVGVAGAGAVPGARNTLLIVRKAK